MKIASQSHKSFAAKTRFRKKRHAKRRHFFLYEHSRGSEPDVSVDAQSSRLGIEDRV
jgi:hypothetical protein